MMQEQAAIQDKLRQVIFRHLQYLLRHSLRPRPQTCANNVGRLIQPGVEIRLCRCLEEASPYDQVCDLRLAGVDKAKACGFWKPLQSREMIRQEFRTKMDRLIRATDRGPLAAEYPDVAALLWVLGSAEDDLWGGVASVDTGEENES